MAVALTGCGLTGPYPGMPVMQAQSNDLRARENRPEWIPYSEPDQSRAPPQVAYRIDENRYFEIVPTTKAPCSSAIIFYVDRRQGIRSEVMDSSRLGGVELVIDAANEDYLVAPIDRGNTDCSSGGGLCGGSKLPYPQPSAPATPCTFAPRPRHAHDDRIYVQHPPGHPDWQRGLGVGAVDAKGRGWWQVPAHARDNRGRLFVNFNPGDRVIGVSAVAGMGWRGIPARLLNAERNAVGVTVMQRIFVRSSAEPHNPPVGSRSGYRQPYYHMQLDRLSVQATYNGPDGQPLAWRTGSGGLLQVEQENWHYMDGGSANRMWKVASERVLGLVPVLGDLSPRGEGGQSEFAYINAPTVPRPANLDEEFDQKVVRYDGDAQGAVDGQPAVAANAEQQQDFLQDAKYAEPQLIHDLDERGFSFKRYETYEEVLQRRRRKDGGKVISPTNHAQILRYASPLSGASTVKDVLTYDLTIGPGYAFGDEAYWDYLLRLADWRVSDPYAVTGVLTEKGGIEHAPAGIARETQAVVAEGRRVEAAAFDRAYGAP